MISHKYKFIMICPPKSGNIGLLPRMKNHIANNVKLIYDKNGKNTESKIYDEFTKKEITRHKGITYWAELYPKKWKEYYKFAFSRNPYDRLISWYFSAKKINLKEADNLKKFIHHRQCSIQLKYFQYKGNYVMDDVFDYNDYEKVLPKICKKLGFTMNPIKLILREDRNHYSKYYTKELIEFINNSTHKQDLTFFKYKFENSDKKYLKSECWLI